MGRKVGCAFCQVRGAGGGVARVADREVALERLEGRLVEDLRDQAHVLVDQDLATVAHRDAGRLLPAVLEGVQPEVGQLGDVLAGGPHAEDAARVLRALVLGVDGHGQTAVAARPLARRLGHGCSLRARDGRSAPHQPSDAGRVRQLGRARSRCGTRWRASRAARGWRPGGAGRRAAGAASSSRVRGQRGLGSGVRRVGRAPTASSSASSGPPSRGTQVWPGRQTMSWRSDSMSEVTVWKGAVVARAAPGRRGRVGATRGAGTRSAGQAGAAGAGAHQVGVGDDVGTADVDGAARSVVLERVGDRAQHVGDRDRLHGAVHPQWAPAARGTASRSAG